MTRRSKREVERALQQLQGGGEYDGPSEILITHHYVETNHPAEVDTPVEKTRIWRDDRGEWHTEEIDVDAGGRADR